MSLQATLTASPGPTINSQCEHILTSNALFLKLVPSLFFTWDPKLLLTFVIQPEHLMSHSCPVLPFGLCIFHFPSYNL